MNGPFLLFALKNCFSEIVGDKDNISTNLMSKIVALLNRPMQISLGPAITIVGPGICLNFNNLPLNWRAQLPEYFGR